jgi:hypothetical protein
LNSSGNARSFTELPISGTSELRKLIALSFALLLPLQTLASMVMPLQIGAEAGALQAEHCPGHGGDATADAEPALGDLACEQCGICHLACAGIVPASDANPHRIPAGRAYVARAEPQPASHTPEEPNPPPVATRS